MIVGSRPRSRGPLGRWIKTFPQTVEAAGAHGASPAGTGMSILHKLVVPAQDGVRADDKPDSTQDRSWQSKNLGVLVPIAHR